MAFYVNQTRHKSVTNITSLFVTLLAVCMLIGIFHIGKFCFYVPFKKKTVAQKPCDGFCWNLQSLCQKAIIKAAKRIINSDKMCRSYSDLNFGVTFLEHSVHCQKVNIIIFLLQQWLQYTTKLQYGLTINEYNNIVIGLTKR